MNYLHSFFLILYLGLPLDLIAQSPSSEIVPKDPELRYGKLSNGITYYIRKNTKPEQRASFYIIQNVGALMEDDDQNGMAHFLEHMAFNGTKNFPGKSLIDGLEKKGVTFGKKINAYTNFNETVYNLTDIQVDDPALLDTCLLILHDWSNNISLENSEIDKERGVIAEEYRTRKSGSQRVFVQTLQFLMAGSKYAERDIIGTMDVILKGSPDRIRDLYHDWYRTDMQAIVVVGDIDPVQMEEKVKKLFSPIPRVENAKERPFIRVPSHKGTRFTVITDKEVTRSTITGYTLFEKAEKYNETREVMEKFTLISLFNSMIRARISELLQKADTPPFLSGTIAYGSFEKGYEVFYVSVSSEAGKEKIAFENIMIQLEKIKRYGFTETELESAKKELYGNLEKAYKSEKFNEEYVDDYQDNFLAGTPIPSKEYEFNETRAMAAKISLEMINKKVQEWTGEDNRTIVVTGAENDSVSHITEAETIGILEKVKSLNITAYQDEDVSKPLVPGELKGSKIIKEKRLKEFGAVEWTLANNARVVYKFSDLEKNNVTFSALSLGGTSLYPPEMMESAGLVPYMIPWFGAGDFDATALQKKLKGKNVRLTPLFSPDECSEGFRGTSSPEDFEILLELLYLYFEQPRFDAKAYDNIIKRNIEAAASRYNDPGNIVNDSITLILNNYNKRIKLSGTQDYYRKAKFEEVEKIYRDRIKDAGDFVFFIVGNIKSDSVKLLVEKYIGSIKDDPRSERWIDNQVRWPQGKIVKEIPVKMDEPKATILINYRKAEKFSPSNYIAFDVISRILRIRYTEIIREKEGGTYGVYCEGSMRHFPVSRSMVMVYFDCKPDNTQKLTGLVYEEIEKLKTQGPSKDDLNKVILAMRKEREEALKRNIFWGTALYSFYYDKVNNISEKSFNKVLDKMDVKQIQKTANTFFSGADKVEVKFVPGEN